MDKIDKIHVRIDNKGDYRCKSIDRMNNLEAFYERGSEFRMVPLLIYVS